MATSNQLGDKKMKRKLTQLSIAALAGASVIISGASKSNAAVTLTETEAATGVTSTAGPGTFNVWIVAVTGYTGLDATLGSTGQDAQILGLSGTLTDTAGDIAAIGKSSNYQNFTTTASNPQANSSGTEPTDASTYFSFPSVTGTSITETGTAGSTSGTASSLTGSWYVAPTGVTGNVGGVEAGQDPQGLVGSDPHAVKGQLAEILIPTGDSATFSGSIIDYGFPTGTPLSFSVGNATPPPTTHGIISLTSGGAAAAGYGSNEGTLAVKNSGPGDYTPTTATLSTPFNGTTGSIAVTNFVGTDPEIYALQLDSNGTPLTASQITTVINDINGQNGNNASTGVTASAIVPGSIYASDFPGYSLLLTGAAGSTTPSELGFDFSTGGGEQDATVPGITVVGVAAVPEPATAASIVLGAAGLLLGRRRNKAVLA
jgi:hypothetical protein